MAHKSWNARNAVWIHTSTDIFLVKNGFFNKLFTVWKHRSLLVHVWLQISTLLYGNRVVSTEACTIWNPKVANLAATSTSSYVF